MKDKPYVEIIESDGRPDEVVSLEAWENHLKRNQSVIEDLFQGSSIPLILSPPFSRTSYFPFLSSQFLFSPQTIFLYKKLTI